MSNSSLPQRMLRTVANLLLTHDASYEIELLYDNPLEMNHSFQINGILVCVLGPMLGDKFLGDD